MKTAKTVVAMTYCTRSMSREATEKVVQAAAKVGVEVILVPYDFVIGELGDAPYLALKPEIPRFERIA